jgi:hypothetical protein
VHNKRFFDEVLEREVARSQRHGGSLALVLFDIDHSRTSTTPTATSPATPSWSSSASRIRPRNPPRGLRRASAARSSPACSPRHRGGALGFAEDIRQLVEREPFVCDGPSFASA